MRKYLARRQSGHANPLSSCLIKGRPVRLFACLCGPTSFGIFTTGTFKGESRVAHVYVTCIGLIIRVSFVFPRFKKNNIKSTLEAWRSHQERKWFRRSFNIISTVPYHGCSLSWQCFLMASSGSTWHQAAGPSSGKFISGKHCPLTLTYSDNLQNNSWLGLDPWHGTVTEAQSHIRVCFPSQDCYVTPRLDCGGCKHTLGPPAFNDKLDVGKVQVSQVLLGVTVHHLGKWHQRHQTDVRPFQQMLCPPGNSFQKK